MHRKQLIGLCAAFQLATASALAQGAAPADEEPAAEQVVYERGGLAGLGLVAGLKLGGGFGQPFSDLGTSFVAELELGYLLPFANRSLQVFVSGQYVAPSTEGHVTTADDRLPGDGTLRYAVTQSELILTMGLLYRVPLKSDLIRPYAAVGARLYLMTTEVSGSGGALPFGTNEETASAGGFYGALGADLFLGPGSLFAEVQFAYAGLDGYVLRDTNTGALNTVLGYRFFI